MSLCNLRHSIHLNLSLKEKKSMVHIVANFKYHYFRISSLYWRFLSLKKAKIYYYSDISTLKSKNRVGTSLFKSQYSSN